MKIVLLLIISSDPEFSDRLLKPCMKLRSTRFSSQRFSSQLEVDVFANVIVNRKCDRKCDVQKRS